MALEIVGRADREHPADAVLRETLRRGTGLTREAGSEVARRVMAFHRWQGRVDAGLAPRARMEAALELSEAYAAAPESFREVDLWPAVPAWIREHLDVGPAWIRAIQMEPRLWIRARPGTGADVAGELGDSTRPYEDELPEAVWYRGRQDLFRTPGFHAGRFEVQDLASQAVGLLCGPKAGQTWWDVCAGEGGKTLHLADQMANRGTVWATDRAAWRLKRLRLRAGRAGLFNIRWGAWDGTGPVPAGAPVDGVLLDAPCSGVGTWQRNPHSRWTLTAADLAELASIQLGLLRRAAGQVKRGGMLVYSVCTLTREETRGVARAFGEAEPEFVPEPVPAPWRREDGRDADHEGWIRPEDRGSNGMFVARWRKR